MRTLMVVATLILTANLSGRTLDDSSTKKQQLKIVDTRPETPHLAFVTEYIRELDAIENIRASAERTQGDTTDVETTFSNTVHSSTLFQLELRSQISALKRMYLKAPYDTLIPIITGFYEKKVELYQRMIDITSAFIAGPQPGVDYGKLTAEMPQVRPN